MSVPIIIKGSPGGPEGKWDEVQAVQTQPFVYITHAGWPGIDDISDLLRMLRKYKLNGFGHWCKNPCSGGRNPHYPYDGRPQWVDDDRLFAVDGVYTFGGNFEEYSYAFGVYTNDDDTIRELLTAWSENERM